MKPHIYFCGSCWALKIPGDNKGIGSLVGYTRYFGTWLEAFEGLQENSRLYQINTCLHQTKDRMGQVNVEVMC